MSPWGQAPAATAASRQPPAMATPALHAPLRFSA